MKHKDIAIAWLNGAEVQVRSNVADPWVSIKSAEKAEQAAAFCDCWEYRIKPKAVKVRIAQDQKLGNRVARIYNDDFSLEQNNNLTVPTTYEWVSDWIEIPVSK